MNPLRTAASALLCTFALVSQQAAAVEYRLPAANSRLIGENQQIPDYSLVVGTPGKVIRSLDPALIEPRLQASADHYRQKGQWLRTGLQPVRAPWEAD